MGRNIGRTLFWIAVALVLLVFLWFVPQLQGQHFSQGVSKGELPALVNEYRRTWAQILGGAALLLGLYFTWRGQRLTQQSLEDSRRSTQENLRLTREGQITERFTQSIELLGKIDDGGKKTLEVRLGGIYALERIAEESEVDRWPIIEILAAYAREHAPGQLPRKALEEELVHPGSLPDPDVQAVLTVIAHINLPYEQHLYEVPGQLLPDSPINLHGAELPLLSLYGANLSRTNFASANLAATVFTKADFRGANLYDADLRRAVLFGADLRNADLENAHLRGARLDGSDLRETCGLTQEQLKTAHGDKNTLLPSDLSAPASWSR